MIDDTLYLISWPHHRRLNLFYNTSCERASGFSVVRYDEEAQRFVISLINSEHNAMCVAIATSTDLEQPFRIFEFKREGFSVSHYLFSVWGDYYNCCWISNSTERWCGVIERSKMINYNMTDMPKITIAQMDVMTGSSLMNAHMYTMYQDKFSRGPLINMRAPCGVFSILKEDGTIEIHMCTSVNFMMGTMNITKSFIEVGPFTPYHSCIPIYNTMSSCKNSFSKHHRMAYYYKDGVEKVAYTFIKYLNGISVVAWGETMTPLHMNPVVRHNTYAPYLYGQGSVFMWAPSIAFDCRSDVFLLYNRISYGKYISLDFTYKIKGDPNGVLRNPESFYSPYYEVSPLMKWGYTHAVAGTISPRRFFGVGSTSDQFATIISMRIANVTMTYRYTASDECGNTDSCMRQMYLTNSENC